MPKLIDFTGRRFGKLIVVSRDGSTAWNHVLWKCRCDCGREKSYPACQLRDGKAKSCGCLFRFEEGVAAFNSTYATYVKRAKTLNLIFEITKDQFRIVSQKRCHYCGALPSNVMRRKHYNGAFTYNGMDRVNNDVGYVLTNVVPCCCQCNIAKCDYTREEFFEWINRVYAKQESERISK